MKVYVGLSLCTLHHGHINLIQQAKKFGPVTVGLLTDDAVVERKQIALLSYEQRKKIAEGLDGVCAVVPQCEWDYSVNIGKYRPSVFVHGDDWKTGGDSVLRSRVMDVLGSYGGRLVEIPHTPDVQSGTLEQALSRYAMVPPMRCSVLRRLLKTKKIVRVLEAHSPLAAIIGEHARFDDVGEHRAFDAFWSSSLADSTILGKPDIELISYEKRLSLINDIFEVTSRPLIFDGDTGGKTEHFTFLVRSLERLGVSAIIIEDKNGLKQNSLFGTTVDQQLEDPEKFADKIYQGKVATSSSDFMIIARLESLIAGRGVDDGLERARTYINGGADAIMIHSSQTVADEIFDFCRRFRDEYVDVPLVAVPSTYNSVKEQELTEAGINMVIYANQMLRAAVPAMTEVAQSILKHQRSLEADSNLMGIKQILELFSSGKT